MNIYYDISLLLRFSFRHDFVSGHITAIVTAHECVFRRRVLAFCLRIFYCGIMQRRCRLKSRQANQKVAFFRQTLQISDKRDYGCSNCNFMFKFLQMGVSA